MKILDLFKTKKTVISFEIFPPKHTTPLETIYNKLEHFKNLNPDFISVTYGAGGSQKGRTLEIATKIKKDYGIDTMAHFTCIGHSINEIDNLLSSLRENGIENILALRGDPPLNDPDFDITKNVFKYAYELVDYIKKSNDFCIAGAAYPEGHVESHFIKNDIDHLKQKVDTGIDFLITQLFLDNKIFFDFLDKTEKANIKCPILAGIMPIFKVDQVKTLALKCGCSIPANVVLMMDKYQDNPDDLLKAGIEYATKQIQNLIDNKVSGIHLYTMNRPVSTAKIVNNISF